MNGKYRDELSYLESTSSQIKNRVRCENTVDLLKVLGPYRLVGLFVLPVALTLLSVPIAVHDGERALTLQSLLLAKIDISLVEKYYIYAQAALIIASYLSLMLLAVHEFNSIVDVVVLAFFLWYGLFLKCLFELSPKTSGFSCAITALSFGTVTLNCDSRTVSVGPYLCILFTLLTLRLQRKFAVLVCLLLCSYFAVSFLVRRFSRIMSSKWVSSLFILSILATLLTEAGAFPFEHLGLLYDNTLAYAKYSLANQGASLATLATLAILLYHDYQGYSDVSKPLLCCLAITVLCSPILTLRGLQDALFFCVSPVAVMVYNSLRIQGLKLQDCPDWLYFGYCCAIAASVVIICEGIVSLNNTYILWNNILQA